MTFKDKVVQIFTTRRHGNRRSPALKTLMFTNSRFSTYQVHDVWTQSAEGVCDEEADGSPRLPKTRRIKLHALEVGAVGGYREGELYYEDHRDQKPQQVFVWNRKTATCGISGIHECRRIHLIGHYFVFFEEFFVQETALILFRRKPWFRTSILSEHSFCFKNIYILL